MLAGLLLLPGVTAADPLPLTPRAISLDDSASRDAPVLELAYGPTLQLSLGGEMGLEHKPRGAADYRFLLSVLGAFEVKTAGTPPPSYFRGIAGIAGAYALKPPAGLGGIVEITAGFAGAWATTLGIPDPIPPLDGIPFGAGGLYAQADVAWRRDFGAWEVTIRIDERVDVPTWLLIFDQRFIADAIADAISDGLTNEPSVDFVLRWRLTPRLQPLLSLHGDVLFPWDPIDRIGFFGRALLGLGIHTAAGEAIPFLSLDAGNGQGLLVNEQRVRFSGGVRYAFF
jgi:hypothetical protein